MLDWKLPYWNISIGGLLARVVLLLLVVLWTAPTAGLLISSLRDPDQLRISGWWTSLQAVTRNERGRTMLAADQTYEENRYVLRGNVFATADGISPNRVETFGAGFLPANDTITYTPFEARGIRDYQAGETVTLADGSRFSLAADGAYEWVSNMPFTHERGQPFYYVAYIPARFSLENYVTVLETQDFGQAFLNTVIVTVPSTIIPVTIAAFAAYTFSWMKFPGRKLLFVLVVGLLVVPLEMSLIPLLRLYNQISHLTGIPAKTYPGIWLAHTGFGLPLAIFLLRNYIGSLPAELVESAQIDGASHMQIFTYLIVPLSVPALAAFATLQFLWVWNDLLVALVFLSKDPSQIVMTSKIRELLGSHAENWEILTSSAFISMAVPLLIFFSMQRYFVRGLMAGSIKG